MKLAIADWPEVTDFHERLDAVIRPSVTSYSVTWPESVPGEITITVTTGALVATREQIEAAVAAAVAAGPAAIAAKERAAAEEKALDLELRRRVAVDLGLAKKAAALELERDAALAQVEVLEGLTHRHA